MKSVVMLATIHQYQMLGAEENSKLERCSDYLRSKFGARIVMEEWAEKLGQSVVAKWAGTLDIPWVSVGPPDEPQFRTYEGPINYPGHDGTLQPPDWHAPGMYEYGPFENQEARENRMAMNVQTEMENYDTGLFVLGLGHTHSVFGKLLSLGFKITCFSCL
jgi:hypothetical protein